MVCLAHIDIVYQAHALADGMAAGLPLGATYLDGGRPRGEQGRDGRAGSLLQYAVDIEAILGQMDGEELRVVIKLHVQLGLRILPRIDPASTESLVECLSPAGSVRKREFAWDIIKVEVVALPVLYLLSEGDDVLRAEVQAETSRTISRLFFEKSMVKFLPEAFPWVESIHSWPLGILETSSSEKSLPALINFVSPSVCAARA